MVRHNETITRVNTSARSGYRRMKSGRGTAAVQNLAARVMRECSLPRTEGGEAHVFVQHFQITEAHGAHLIQLKRQ